MVYEKCLVELDEILKYLSNEYLSKIPYEIRKNIKQKKDSNYTWNYDETKELSEQNINRETIIMLAYLNMQFLLNVEEKTVMEQFHKYNEEKVEKEKLEKYNPNNIFKANNTDSESNKVMLVKIEEKKWYQKIFDFFKKFIRK